MSELENRRFNDICRACAEAAGGSIPAGHQPGWWQETCEVCGEFKGVTAARDWRLNDEAGQARLAALRLVVKNMIATTERIDEALSDLYAEEMIGTCERALITAIVLDRSYHGEYAFLDGLEAAFQLVRQNLAAINYRDGQTEDLISISPISSLNAIAGFQPQDDARDIA